MILKVKDGSIYHMTVTNALGDCYFIVMNGVLHKYATLPLAVLAKNAYKLTAK